MSVKNLLAQQDSEFISLHEILDLMTQIDGASYAEAATLLHRLLWGDSRDVPAWWTKDDLYGVNLANDDDVRTATGCLVQAARSGKPQFEEPDEIPF